MASLNANIDKALANPTVRENFLTQAQEPVGGSADQFSRLFCDDYVKYQRVNSISV